MKGLILHLSIMIGTGAGYQVKVRGGTAAERAGECFRVRAG